MILSHPQNLNASGIMQGYIHHTTPQQCPPRTCRPPSTGRHESSPARASSGTIHGQGLLLCSAVQADAAPRPRPWPPRVDMSRAMWWRQLQRALPGGAADQRRQQHGMAPLLPGRRLGTPTRVPHMLLPARSLALGFKSVPSSRRACECERRRSLSPPPASCVHHLAAFSVAFGASTSPARTFFSELGFPLIIVWRKKKAAARALSACDAAFKLLLGGYAGLLACVAKLGFGQSTGTKKCAGVVSARHVPWPVGAASWVYVVAENFCPPPNMFSWTSDPTLDISF